MPVGRLFSFFVGVIRQPKSWAEDSGGEGKARRLPGAWDVCWRVRWLALSVLALVD